MDVYPSNPRPLVHLELHTGDRARASAFYARLLRWRPELIRAASGSYLSLELGSACSGGIVECGTLRPMWLPYVEVESGRGAHRTRVPARRDGVAGAS